MPKLPLDILRRRVKQELAMCNRKLEHQIEIKDEDITDFPVLVRINMQHTPGPTLRNKKMTHRYSHTFVMKITDEYPYEKPIVRWRTPIFHPNIMLPEDGGHVCTKLLDDWGFNSNLLAFIRGLESLLTNPNPASPWGSKSCMAAAQYFVDNEYRPPTIVKTDDKGPKILPVEEVNDEDGEDEEDEKDK
jgi:ubiquitin-conjugating enzyme E2 C